MSKTNSMLIVVLLCFGRGASCSEIAGQISAADNHSKANHDEQQVVIWVEGVPGVEVPSERPVLRQTDLQFNPPVMVVTAGQTVDMPNDDFVAHNVFSLSPAKQFKLGIYPQGETRSVTFEKLGVIDLFCSVHRHMHAVIIVTPSPHFAMTTIGKSYRIENVPAGTYTVRTWSADYPQQSRPVTVPAAGAATLNFSFAGTRQKTASDPSMNNE
jgi:plastocyanin